MKNNCPFYHSVYVITFDLAQSDHIKLLLRYVKIQNKNCPSFLLLLQFGVRDKSSFEVTPFEVRPN